MRSLLLNLFVLFVAADEPAGQTQAVIDVAGGADLADPVGELNFTDSSGVALSTLPQMAPLATRCQQAVRRAVADSYKSAPQLQLYPDPLHGVRVGSREHADDLRFVFFILASRPSAPYTVPRLIHALYDP